MSDDKSPDLGNLTDMGGIMDLAQKLQGEVTKMQDELARKEYEASAGGGMVTARVNGQYDVVSIHIEKDVMDPNDIEMLQDLIVAAINQAMGKVRDATKDGMSKLTGGLRIPGMPNLF